MWIAAVRTVVQLGLLGLVLEWVFKQRSGYLIAAVLASMVINAGIAAVRRTERRFAGIWQSGLIAVTLSSVITAPVGSAAAWARMLLALPTPQPSTFGYFWSPDLARRASSSADSCVA